MSAQQWRTPDKQERGEVTGGFVRQSRLAGPMKTLHLLLVIYTGATASMCLTQVTQAQTAIPRQLGLVVVWEDTTDVQPATTVFAGSLAKTR